MDYARLAFDAIEQMEQATTVEGTILAVRRAIASLGFASFLIADAPETTLNAPPPIHLNGWPASWLETYLAENLYASDPVAAHLRREARPFDWAEAPIDSGIASRSRDVMELARQHGMTSGFVVPIRSASLGATCMTVAGEAIDRSRSARLALQVVAHAAYAKAMDLKGLMGAPQIDLSEGERDVLVWTAVGKTAREISVILDLSEAGVVWRLQQAQRKLRASNKVHAVALALRHRFICI